MNVLIIYTILSQRLFILRRTQRDLLVKVYRSSSKVIIIITRLRRNLSLLDSCSKNPQILNFMKILPVEAEFYHGDGHTYIHTRTYIHTYTHIHTYIHTRTYIHTHIHTYIHIYIKDGANSRFLQFYQNAYKRSHYLTTVCLYSLRMKHPVTTAVSLIFCHTRHKFDPKISQPKLPSIDTRHKYR